jgi:FdhD protein
MSRTRRTSLVRWDGEAPPIDVSDEVAIEEPLEIRIRGRPVSITMRTPGHDVELVAGMLLTEGLIAAAEVPLIRHEHPNIVNVAAAHDESLLDHVRRTTITSASCGLCGKSTIEAVHQHFPAVDDDVTLTPATVAKITSQLERAQATFARTGGVHAAALFNREGTLVVAREDVGRHNAVDKAIGYALLRGLLPLKGHVLLVSGRASFEIVQKALGACIPVVAAVSAPSSLALELAESSGQTLIGFLRGNRWNVYTHPERITAEASAMPG